MSPSRSGSWPSLRVCDRPDHILWISAWRSGTKKRPSLLGAPKACVDNFPGLCVGGDLGDIRALPRGTCDMASSTGRAGARGDLPGSASTTL